MKNAKRPTGKRKNDKIGLQAMDKSKQQKLQRPNFRAARKYASITTLGKRQQPPMLVVPPTQPENSKKLPLPNVTDFLTFLCYRRTHALPAKLNFNKLFAGTGEHHQVVQKQPQPQKKDKVLPFVDNNNKGESFTMKVVLRKLFLDEETEKEPEKKIKKPKKPHKSAKKCLKKGRPKKTKAIVVVKTSRIKTDRKMKTKTKSLKVPKQQQRKQREAIVTRSSKKKIKFIRN